MHGLPEVPSKGCPLSLPVICSIIGQIPSAIQQALLTSDK